MEEWKTSIVRKARVNPREGYELATIQGPETIFLEFRRVEFRRGGSGEEVRSVIKTVRMPIDAAARLLIDVSQLIEVCRFLKKSNKLPGRQITRVPNR